MVWFGMVWYGTVACRYAHDGGEEYLYGMGEWYVVRYCLVPGIFLYGVIRQGKGMIRYGTVWYGRVPLWSSMRHGIFFFIALEWCGTVWSGI